ncbi:MAG: EamA family transporter, partial [Gemmatimonadota bacterium]
LAATYAYVNPVVAVFLGWALAGEAITLRTILAAGVIVGGVILITSARGKATEIAVQPSRPKDPVPASATRTA